MAAPIDPAPDSGAPTHPVRSAHPAPPRGLAHRGTRAAPLPPDERRGAIIAAALPLLRLHGSAVTTRQIAQAAGIAEGTIFRVFRGKQELIDSAVTTALDPQQVLDALGGIDPAAPLPDRLRAIVDILQARLAGVISLMVALRMPRPPGEGHRHPRQEQMLPAIEKLLAADADALRMAPADAARVIRLFVFAGTHPGITDHKPLTGEQVTDILLHGIANERPSPDGLADDRPLFAGDVADILSDGSTDGLP